MESDDMKQFDEVLKALRKVCFDHSVAFLVSGGCMEVIVADVNPKGRVIGEILGVDAGREIYSYPRKEG